MRTLLTKSLANELAEEVMKKDQDARAKVGTHVVNGEKRHVVHVTYKQGVGVPYNIARA